MELLTKNIQQFFDFADERHTVYLCKERGDEWPWTNDIILQTYKFTNVYRELDRGTVWYREHIREPYAQDPELFFNTCVYRRHNWIGTGEFLGYIHDYDAKQVTQSVLSYQAAGNKVFTGAHMLCGDIKDGDYQPKGKVEQIFGIAFRKLWEQRRELEPKPGDSLEAAFNRLNGKIPGYGAFITYEVITDLRHTRYLCDAPDIMTWANPGPGATRGIVRLMGNEVSDYKAYPKRDACIAAMRVLLELSPNYLGEYMPAMEMRDIEHTLCEWDKYKRVQQGQGRPRQKYSPPNGGKPLQPTLF